MDIAKMASNLRQQRESLDRLRSAASNEEPAPVSLAVEVLTDKARRDMEWLRSILSEESPAPDVFLVILLAIAVFAAAVVGLATR